MTKQFETFEEFAATARQTVGALLLTVSVVSDQGQSMSRVYTSHPQAYPIGGKKAFGTDAPRLWLEQVVHRRAPFLGPNKAAVRAMFFDFEVTEALGCGAAINVPVVSNGQTIGSINFLDEEGRYDDTTVIAALEIAERSRHLLETSSQASNEPLHPAN